MAGCQDLTWPSTGSAPATWSSTGSAGAGSASPSSASEGEPEHRAGWPSLDADPIPSYPFPADFQLVFHDSRIEACHHRCQLPREGATAIVLFFPGVHGGVGPCRRPGTNYDDAALFPTLANQLVESHNVDCYRCSWPFMRPHMACAVGGALRILHHGVLEALKDGPENEEHREFRIFFVGHSLGGSVAIQAAEVVARHFGMDGKSGQRMEGLEHAVVRMRGVCTLNGAFDVHSNQRSLDSLQQTHALFINGDADQVVPPEVTRELFEAFPSTSKKRRVLHGGTHDLFSYKETLLGEITDFIATNLTDSK